MFAERLKNFQVDRLDVGELLELRAVGKLLRVEYEAADVPTPEWLTDSLRTLNTEVDRRRKDELERRLKQLKAEDSADRTASERREDRAKERERIEKALVGSQA